MRIPLLSMIFHFFTRVPNTLQRNACNQHLQAVYQSALFRRARVPVPSDDTTIKITKSILRFLACADKDLGDSYISARVLEYYTPVALYLIHQRTLQPEKPLVVGLSIPQGGGKTTLADCLTMALKEINFNVVSISIDDFYSTHDELETLASKYPQNTYLQGRGTAGTHDIPLGTKTLSSLVHADAGTSVYVPRYDKSAHGGRGDRACKDDWMKITGPVDVILFEGWSMGFEPIPAHTLALKSFPGMEVVNEKMSAYKQWHQYLDVAIIARAAADYVFDWREEAELPRRRAGKGMSKEETRAFIQRFMPSYELYADNLWEHGIAGVDRYLRYQLDSSRSPF